jgi:hypothetical protein
MVWREKGTEIDGRESVRGGNKWQRVGKGEKWMVESGKESERREKKIQKHVMVQSCFRPKIVGSLNPLLPSYVPPPSLTRSPPSFPHLLPSRLLPNTHAPSKNAGEGRPDYRWLIMGPARSGSSFHVDPNCNFAWNATIQVGAPTQS